MLTAVMLDALAGLAVEFKTLRAELHGLGVADMNAFFASSFVTSGALAFFRDSVTLDAFALIFNEVLRAEILRADGVGGHALAVFGVSVGGAFGQLGDLAGLAAFRTALIPSLGAILFGVVCGCEAGKRLVFPARGLAASGAFRVLASFNSLAATTLGLALFPALRTEFFNPRRSSVALVLVRLTAAWAFRELADLLVTTASILSSTGRASGPSLGAEFFGNVVGLLADLAGVVTANGAFLLFSSSFDLGAALASRFPTLGAVRFFISDLLGTLHLLAMPVR